MQAPPPFEQSFTPRRKGVSPWVWVLGAISLFCLLAIIGTGALVFSAFKSVTPLMTCSMNLFQAQAAILKYADAHGGKLPPASTWQDDVAKYYSTSFPGGKSSNEKGLKQLNIHVSPINRPLPCSAEMPSTGLYYNSDLAGRKVADIKDPSHAWILFESEGLEMNGHKSWKPRSTQGSPKMMGTVRGWIKASLTKLPNPLEQGGMIPPPASELPDPENPAKGKEPTQV